MLILPKQIQLCNQTFAYLKEIHYLCSQIKFALLGLGCPRSEKGCHRQLFFITPLEILSCHTSCHPPDRYSFSRHRMPSSHRQDKRFFTSRSKSTSNPFWHFLMSRLCRIIFVLFQISLFSELIRSANNSSCSSETTTPHSVNIGNCGSKLERFWSPHSSRYNTKLSAMISYL